MNAEAKQPRATLNLVGEWEFASQQRARDMLLKAGLSMLDASRMVKAERIASTLAALVTLMKRDLRLKDAESDDDEDPGSAALNGYLAGGLVEAIELLADELYREVSSVGGAE